MDDAQTVIRLGPKEVFFVLCEPKKHSIWKLRDVLGFGGFHFDELEILSRPDLGNRVHKKQHSVNTPRVALVVDVTHRLEMSPLF